MATRKTTIFFTLSLLLLFLSLSTAQQQQQPSPAPAPAPAPSSESCNGVFLAYTHTKTTRIPPNLLKSDPTRQPYRFESTLEVLNNGLDELKQWRVFVGFGHGARLNSASNAVLADGEILPAEVGNGTVLAGFPASDLETAVDTAGDLSQMGVRVEFVGVHFGVEPPDVPLPSNISLVNDGFLCPKPTLQGKSRMEVCCTEDTNFKPNTTTLEDEFLPRQSGDLTIMFDVLRTYDSSYWAEVAIANHNPLGRLDFWRLSWDWTKGEFIHSMIGAFPSVVDSSDCIFGPQGQHYRELDFSNVLNCQRRPTIVDLPLSMYNDTKFGLRPYCCRNGTILPPQMDSGRSISKFQMEIFKMPEELNRSRLTPPVNWGVIGTSMNPNYDCGPPVRVSPSESPDDSGVPVNSTAVASWQVVCNITQPTRDAPKKCCVSFSAYYNDSVIPCGTCACGCGSANRVCSSTAPAMLLPPEALLIPFENRTAKALAWAQLKRSPVPNPLPCGDGCGVSLNWHVVSDYTKGWSARVTVFNWGDESFPDWFASAEMKNAVPGFEKMYSFNGSAIAIGGAINNTLFMEGLPGLNYLVAESDGANPDKDPRVPGKQQTVISFTKKTTPGINVPRGDGFPTKVFFNGEECALPAYFPSNGVTRKAGFSTLLVVALAVFVLIL